MKVPCLKCSHSELEHEGLGVPLFICDDCCNLTKYNLPACQDEHFDTEKCNTCRYRFKCWTERHQEPETIVMIAPKKSWFSSVGCAIAHKAYHDKRDPDAIHRYCRKCGREWVHDYYD